MHTVIRNVGGFRDFVERRPFKTALEEELSSDVRYALPGGKALYTCDDRLPATCGQMALTRYLFIAYLVY